MDAQNRTLGSVLSQNNPGMSGTIPNSSYNTYLTLLGVNLANRFPDVTDLNKIDIGTIHSVAEFSFICSSIAVDVWDNLVTTQPQSRPYSRQKSA